MARFIPSLDVITSIRMELTRRGRVFVYVNDTDISKGRRPKAVAAIYARAVQAWRDGTSARAFFRSVKVVRR